MHNKKIAIDRIVFNTKINIIEKILTIYGKYPYTKVSKLNENEYLLGFIYLRYYKIEDKQIIDLYAKGLFNYIKTSKVLFSPVKTLINIIKKQIIQDDPNCIINSEETYIEGNTGVVIVVFTIGWVLLSFLIAFILFLILFRK